MIELNGRRSVAAAKPKKPFLSTSKECPGRYDFIRRQEDSFGRTKPNLAERSQKTQYFQSDVSKSRMQRAIGQVDREDRSRVPDPACKGIVVTIDVFNFGRKRGSVGAASAVFRLRLSSRAVACAERG